MPTSSIQRSCDELIEMVLEWKGKGLRFHLEIKNNKPTFWFSEIPGEIEDRIRELYAASVDELVRRFTPPSDEKVAVEFNGGDLFAALEAASKTTTLDYDLIKRLNSKLKHLDMPWKWKPCETTKVPCAIGTTCFGNAYWSAKRDKKPINIPEVRQCPYMWKLDHWWECECRGWNIQPIMHEGRMQYVIEGETFWQMTTRRKREIAQEVEHVLRNRPQQEESPLELDEDEHSFMAMGDFEGYTADPSEFDYNPLDDV